MNESAVAAQSIAMANISPIFQIPRLKRELAV
jgi:hypothetical protein